MTITHIVMFRFSGDVTESEIEALERDLTCFPTRIPVIASYRFGRDLGMDAGTFDFGIVASFTDEEAYRAYRDDPFHREFIATRIRPLIVERSAIQVGF